MQVLNARVLKCTVVLDPVEVAQLVAPDGKPRVVIDIRLPDRRVTPTSPRSPSAGRSSRSASTGPRASR
jgi:hypothetical protein